MFGPLFLGSWLPVARISTFHVFGVVAIGLATFRRILASFFEVCWEDDLLVSLGFLDLGCWSGPVFGRFWAVF